jgi:hypothetical protein
MSDDKMVLVQDGAMQPSSFQELRALAKDAADSKFFGMASPQQALVAMMAGRDLGLSYMQSLRAFHIIEGRPALSAEAMVAVCLGRPDVCEFFRTVSVGNASATVETKRVGSEPRQETFTVEDAKTAGLVKDKGNWVKYPGRMCLARARSFLARDVYPDLLMGLYDPDELESRPSAPVARVVEQQRPSARPSVQDAIISPVDDEEAALEAQEDNVDGVEIVAAALANRIRIAKPYAMRDLAGEIKTLEARGLVTEDQVVALKAVWRDRAAALKGTT